jgi:hypothetical protein
VLLILRPSTAGGKNLRGLALVSGLGHHDSYSDAVAIRPGKALARVNQDANLRYRHWQYASGWGLSDNLAGGFPELGPSTRSVSVARGR